MACWRNSASGGGDGDRDDGSSCGNGKRGERVRQPDSQVIHFANQEFLEKSNFSDIRMLQKIKSFY